MSSVTEMLAKTHSRYNKGRNRILTAAVCLCILTLTIVFGIASGKIEAEYLKAEIEEKRQKKESENRCILKRFLQKKNGKNLPRVPKKKEEK